MKTRTSCSKATLGSQVWIYYVLCLRKEADNGMLSPICELHIPRGPSFYRSITQTDFMKIKDKVTVKIQVIRNVSFLLFVYSTIAVLFFLKIHMDY